MSALSALREECEEVSTVVLALPESDFARPTRCTEWNVKQLLGHMYRDVNRINEGLATPAPAEITHDSVSYWRSYDKVGEAAETATRAKDIAAGYATGHALADSWDGMWRKAVDAAEAEDPGRLIVTWGPALTLEEFLRTRVLEITVHRMDLEAAFGRKCWGTDGAVGIVDEILVDLLGKEPPHELDWDAIDFIETGCGRRELTEEERSLLGVRAAGKFPLIG